MMTEVVERVWQETEPGEWNFGCMVRGIVRRPYHGQIYRDEEQDPEYIWLCVVRGHKIDDNRGACISLQEAVDACEERLRVLGVLT